MTLIFDENRKHQSRKEKFSFVFFKRARLKSEKIQNRKGFGKAERKQKFTFSCIKVLRVAGVLHEHERPKLTL